MDYHCTRAPKHVCGQSFAVMLDPVAIFHTPLTCGVRRPTEDLGFLKDTLRELCHLMNDGINFMGRKIKVNLRCFVCDSPACAKVTLAVTDVSKKECGLTDTYQETVDLLL